MHLGLEVALQDESALRAFLFSQSFSAMEEVVVLDGGRCIVLFAEKVLVELRLKCSILTVLF